MFIAIVLGGVLVTGLLMAALLPDSFDYDPPRCHCCGQSLEY